MNFCLKGNNNNNANNMNTIMFMPMNGRRLHRRWADRAVEGEQSYNKTERMPPFHSNPFSFIFY